MLLASIPVEVGEQKSDEVETERSNFPFPSWTFDAEMPRETRAAGMLFKPRPYSLCCTPTWNPDPLLDDV